MNRYITWFLVFVYVHGLERNDFFMPICYSFWPILGKAKDGIEEQSIEYDVLWKSLTLESILSFSSIPRSRMEQLGNQE